MHTFNIVAGCSIFGFNYTPLENSPTYYNGYRVLIKMRFHQVTMINVSERQIISLEGQLPLMPEVGFFSGGGVITQDNHKPKDYPYHFIILL